MSQADEETPLVRQRTPFPWSQFTIVLLLQLPEPITAQVISPFTPQLIRDIGITHGDEKKVGYYVGILQSLFFLAQALTVLHWSRTSDRIGRRPVVLVGLLGVAISMICFGLSKTFWNLVLSRSLSGLLNGNSGVIKSIVAEITDSSNIAQAYAYMPITWSIGGVIGPIIGGSLSHPADQFPTFFGMNKFLKEYPYFLACAIPATIAMLTSFLTYFCLTETVEDPRPIFSPHSFFRRVPHVDIRLGGTPRPPIKPPLLPFRSLLTPPVLIAAANYASLALIDAAFRAIQPLFLSTPVHLGGLGLPPSTIGTILSIHGIANGLFQVICFAWIHNRWGPKRPFMTGLLLAAPTFVMFPVMNWAARWWPSEPGYFWKEGEGGLGAGPPPSLSGIVWGLVVVQVALSLGLNISFGGAVFIFIAMASPNRASLGATNGLSQMSVSVTRAIAPALATSLFSLSMEKEFLGGYLVYYILVALTGIACMIGSLLPGTITSP